jgi:hypothetical protein
MSVDRSARASSYPRGYRRGKSKQITEMGKILDAAIRGFKKSLSEPENSTLEADRSHKDLNLQRSPRFPPFSR